jgi:hypothetical protein
VLRSESDEQLYKRAHESPLGKFKELGAAYEELRATMGLSLVETGGKAAEVLTPLLNSLQTFAGQHQNMSAAGAAVLGLGTSAIAATEPTSNLSAAIAMLRGGSGGGAGGGGIAGTGVGVSDIITGAWAGGQGVKGAGRVIARGGLGILGKVPGPLGIAAIAGALGFGLYNKDEKDSTGSSAPHKFNREYSGKLFRQISPEYKQPESMKGLIQDVNRRTGSGQLPKGVSEQMLKIAEVAFPESYKKATTELASGMQELTAPAKANADAFGELLSPMRSMPGATDKAVSAVTSFADRINNIRVGGAPAFLEPPRFGTPSKPDAIFSAPSVPEPRPKFNFDYKTGSRPAPSMTAPKLISSARGGGMHVGSIPITVNLPPGVATDAPDELARKVGAAVRQELARLDFDQMVDDRVDFRTDTYLERG